MCGLVDGFKFDGGLSTQAALSAFAVVGLLDPGDDRETEVLAGVPALPVQDVLLQEREERLHRAVVCARPTRPIEPTSLLRRNVFVNFLDRNCDPRSECTTTPTGRPRNPIAFRSADTARPAFMRESIE